MWLGVEHPKDLGFIYLPLGLSDSIKRRGVGTAQSR